MTQRNQTNSSSNITRTNQTLQSTAGTDGKVPDIIAFTGGLAVNFLLLVPFMRCHKPGLWKPFNIYVVNLAIANILRLITLFPPVVIARVYGLKVYVGALCHMQVFCTMVFGGLIISLHAIMALNRTWAIVHPLSYRVHHSKRLSLIYCLALWAVNFLIHGIHPLVLRLTGHRLPATTFCQESVVDPVNSVRLTSMLGYAIPMICIFSAFPVILIAYCRQQAKKKTSAQTHSGPCGPSTQVTTASGNRVSFAKHGPSGAPPQQPTVPGKKGVQNVAHKFVVLGLLTATVLICTVPYLAFSMLQGIRHDFFNVTFFVVSNLLFQFQAFFDALLFMLALQDLRMAVWRSFKSLF